MRQVEKCASYFVNRDRIHLFPSITAHHHASTRSYQPFSRREAPLHTIVRFDFDVHGPFNTLRPGPNSLVTHTNANEYEKRFRYSFIPGGWTTGSHSLT